MVRKKVDARVRQLIESSVKLRHRSLFVLVGDHGKDQVVNLHLMLSKTQVKARPSVLWCYKKELRSFFDVLAENSIRIKENLQEEQGGAPDVTAPVNIIFFIFEENETIQCLSNLGFSTHRQKRMKQIKKAQARGTYDNASEDPFDLFVSQTDIRWCYYKDSHKVLGQTFGMLVLQDFEALTPNLLARTVETVEGGGIVILLLRTVTSLKQLYTMTMDCHDRFRTEQHQTLVPRFNERFILSLSQCDTCLVLDDELNILPISSEQSKMKKSIQDEDDDEDKDSLISANQMKETKELNALVQSLADTQPSGALVALCKTLDQARAVLTFLDAVSEKKLRSTVALTAARGRGKSAALGICLAGAIAYGYANIFVTAPSPENLNAVFEFALKGLDALHFEEHLDYEVLQSTHDEYNKAVVRINIFKDHRQTIQYITPSDHARLSQAELLIIDEAAAIPLPIVKNLLGPYLVFMATTVNGYEGTGRSLSLKLISDLRKRQGVANLEAAQKAGGDVVGPKSKKGQGKVHEERWKTSAEFAKNDGGGGGGSGRSLREIELSTPIRYASGDTVESWLNELLCLDVFHEHSNNNRLCCGTPAPQHCELFSVNRDALFSHHALSEAFLQRVMSMYTSAHYKNTPNDLQLLSDAPAHELFVLLGPNAMDNNIKKTTNKNNQIQLPDILCVIQVAFEGRISKKTLGDAFARGRSSAGDLIPWTLSNQFGDDGFAQLCGARIVRIATHPDVMRMGYGKKAMELLLAHFRGDLLNLDSTFDEDEDDDDEDEEIEEKNVKKSKKQKTDGSSSGNDNLYEEIVAPRSKMPPLLMPASGKPPPLLHWCGVSFGVTPNLLNFWLRLNFELCYLRQTQNDITGEHTAILLTNLSNHRHNSLLASQEEEGFANPSPNWLSGFVCDARRRLVSLIAFSFKDMTASTALSLLGGGSASINRLHHGFGSEGGGDGGENDDDDDKINHTIISAKEINLFMTSYDLKRLDMYSHNMVDHHLVTDLIPNLARLYFLGHLNDGAISLSMVQKALLLGVGLQHRSVDDLSVELNLPVNQVLALFNKAVRKLNAHLKKVVESDVEKNMLASKLDAKRIAKTTEKMSRTATSLDEDMQAGANDVMDIINNKQNDDDDDENKKNKKNGTTTALLLDDAELMSYAIKGDDEQWAQVTQNGSKKVSSITLKNELKRDHYDVISEAAAASGNSSSSNINKILSEVEEERLEKENKGKKKKKARILAGGFNETIDKKDKKKDKKTPIKKPQGKYKNV